MTTNIKCRIQETRRRVLNDSSIDLWGAKRQVVSALALKVPFCDYKATERQSPEGSLGLVIRCEKETGVTLET